jgi:parvulin-like peptidyl-prolyl isomerase
MKKKSPAEMIRKFTRIFTAFFVLCLFFVILMLSCTSSREEIGESHKKIIARVDGEPVFESDVIRRIKVSHREVDQSKVGQERWQRMLDEATETEIIEKLLLKEALSKGIETDKEEVDSFFNSTREMLGEEGFQQMLKKRSSTKQEYREYLKERNLIKKYKEKLFKNLTVDDKTLETYFERHRESFKKPESVSLEVVTVDSAETADKIFEKAKKDKDLEKLAAEYSTDDKRVIFRRTKLVPYEAIPLDMKLLIKEAEVGDIVKPAHVGQQVKIYKILDKRSEYLQTFEEVKEDLRESFLIGRRQKVIDDWYEAAKKKVTIEYVKK